MMMKEDLDLMRRPRSDRPCGNLTLSLEPPASSLASQDVGPRSSTIIRAGTGAPLVGRNPHERRLPSFVIREKVLGHFRHKRLAGAHLEGEDRTDATATLSCHVGHCPSTGPDPSVSPTDGVDLLPLCHRWSSPPES